jgi:hypothetical protein
MTLNALPAEMDPSWRKTVTSGSWSSRHFLLAVCFNLLNLISLANVWKLYHLDPRVDRYLDLFLLLMVWFLAMLGYFALHLYRAVKGQITNDATDAASETLLRVGFIGYRLYLFALATFFLVLGAIGLAHS